MPSIKVNGVSLAVYEWQGSGPAIVAIHGLTANHTCWAPLADSLTPDFRFIAYDLRGRGESDKPSSGYSLAHHCQDLLGLLDAMRLPRAVIAGHSLGANIAVAFADRHPERVEKLVLVDGGFDFRAEVLDSLQPALARLDLTFPSMEVFLGLMQQLPPLQGRWNDYVERYFRYDVETASDGSVRSKVAKHAIEEELANLQRERLWALHHLIACPTLILRAPDGLLTESDCLMTHAEGEAIAAAIKGSRLVTIEGENHYSILLGKNPETLNAIRLFLLS
jgi:pimeloyl-ACP methyl ester carboxylesterase